MLCEARASDYSVTVACWGPGLAIPFMDVGINFSAGRFVEVKDHSVSC
jgi:hypothetical protein